jgi:tellurite methyltransferase
MKKTTWADYYKITKNNPPTKLLVDSLGFVKIKNKALELGAGSPRDSIFLANKGFDVVAVDKTPGAKELFENINKNKITFIKSSMEDLDFHNNDYDLISAQRVLPFIENKKLLTRVFENIKRSLKKDGVFVGHFFGPKDTWCLEGKNMTFVDEKEIKVLLKDFSIKVLKELEKDSETAKGTPHHWHIFNIIAVKN